MPAEEAVVRFEMVGMRYGRAPEILTDVSFESPRGAFHFLTGATGAGKSSLLSLIYMANRPSRGLISLFGRDLSQVSRQEIAALRRKIGVAFEDIRLLDHLSAFDNVAVPLRLDRKNARKHKEDVEELMSWVGLSERMSAMPSTLSSGEKKRVALARALISRPALILADEPTSNLDPDTAARVMRLLIQMTRQGTSVIVSTHDTELVAGSGLPVLHLDRGRITRFRDGIA